jgi:short-subunit dehydrogenase
MTKSILITGASRGLGEHLARQFARRGYALALTARTLEPLQKLAEEFAGQAAKIVIRQLDVTDYASISGVITECAQELGGLDIIVANAGVGSPTAIGQGQLDAIRQTIDVNVTGAIATSEAAIALFRQQGRGQLVGLTSVAKVRGLPGGGVYSASKAAFAIYLQAARLETRGQNILVTELAPGYIDTDLNRKAPSRPFLVSTDKGTRLLADLIEKQVGFRFVPVWPWTLVAQLIKWLPASLIARMG